MRPLLEILHREINGKLDPKLYPYKPRSIPFHIKDKAKSLLKNLESQGFIRKLGPEEASDFFAQVGFVPKISGKLRFVVNFTALNRYVQIQQITNMKYSLFKLTKISLKQFCKIKI